MSPRRRVTQGNLSRKNPLPAESSAGASPAAAPALSRVPAPRGSLACPPAGPLPPSARLAVPPGPACQPRAGLIADVDATPAPLRLESSGPRMRRKA
jgi:hypothetical protein